MYKKRQGFTIIELVFVISIICVLSSIMIPTYKGYIEKARNVKVISIGESIFCAANYVVQNRSSTISSSDFKTEVENMTGVGLQNAVITQDKSTIRLSYQTENKNYEIEIDTSAQSYVIREQSTRKVIFQ